MRGTMAEEADDHVTEVVTDDAAPLNQASNTDQGEGSDSSRTPSEIEDLAQEMGWASKEKWHGDPAKWKPAKDFVKSTVDVNRSLSKDVRELRDETRRILKTQSVVVEREVEKRLEEATTRFNQAVADGDAEGAYRATRDIDRARASATSAEEPPAASWAKDNPWFGTHDEASDLAYGVCARLAGQGKSQEDQLAAARKAVEKAFPDLFPNQAKAKSDPKDPPPMQGGQRITQASTRKKGVNDLPPTARKAAEEMNRKYKLSLTDYAATYWEENP